MKGHIILLLVWMTFIVSNAFSQNVSINTTGNAADTSAILDVSSTSKGILIPRMSQAQRTAIFSPADGLLVYQNDGTAGFYFYTSASGWTPLVTGTSSQWTTSGSNIFYNTGRVGIGTSTPATALHLVGTNPLTLTGVQPGTIGDSLLTITSGLVRKLSLSSLTNNALTSLNGLTATSQSFATPGTNGTAPAWSSAGSVHTLNIPLAATTSVTAGLLSNADWTTFNNKATVSGTWSTTGNSGTNPGNNFLGTTGNNSLAFRTNNTQRLIVDSIGSIAIGSAPAFSAGAAREKLLVDAGSTSSNPTPAGAFNVISGKGYLDNYLQLNIQNFSPTAAASADIVASNNAATELANFVDMGINSSANTSTGIIGGANTAYLYSTGSDFSIGNATAGKNLRFFTGGTASANERMEIDSSGNVSLNNVQSGANTDSLLTIQGGVIKKLSPSSLNTSSTAWSLNGNTGINRTTAFLGTTDNVGLKLKSNNIQGILLDSLGNVGIGAAPSFSSGIFREKFLVDAGTTLSYNPMVVQGSIDSFFQFNIQNFSSGTHASSDVVATSNVGTETSYYVDMGINCSGNTSNIFGRSNDAYLYNVGENFFIGASTPNKSLIFLQGGSDSATNEKMRLAANGNIGMGVAVPTAVVQIKAGRAAAGSAPMKFTAGTNLTTAEAGAVEFDGTNYFATSGTTRYTLAKTLTATANLDFPSTATGASTLSITVNGAADGDVVSLGVPNANAGPITTAFYTAYVSAANTVTVKFVNGTGAFIDPPSGVFRVSIIKY